MWHSQKFFFFSSRRRHTRYIGDWSSDVCSSDLRDGDTQRRADDGEPDRRDADGHERGADDGERRRRLPVLAVERDDRSEERRVGKEGRSRGAPWHKKKNEDDAESPSQSQKELKR